MSDNDSNPNTETKDALIERLTNEISKLKEENKRQGITITDSHFDRLDLKDENKRLSDLMDEYIGELFDSKSECEKLLEENKILRAKCEAANNYIISMLVK